MCDIHAPRYESTVDAAVGPFLQNYFPEIGCFKVVAHHKVRKEVDGTQPREPWSYLAHVVDWLPCTVGGDAAERGGDSQEIQDTYDDIMFSDLQQSYPALLQSTPRLVAKGTGDVSEYFANIDMSPRDGK